MALQITPLSDALGAEVIGVDLTKPVTDDDLTAMKDAFAEHLVLVIRDQHLSPAQYIAAANLFGNPMRQYFSDMLMEDHPEISVIDSREAPILPNGEPRLVGSGAWHTDHTNTPKPPDATLLYAIQLPSTGGDTGFANMRKAYALLPEEERARLAPMKTVNTLVEVPDYVNEEDAEAYSRPCIHPLIRTHPVTGEKAIWSGTVKVERIEGMEPEESRAFLNELLARVIQPDVIYRHKWKPGDLVIWDNRATMHMAFRDYDHMEGRITQRILLEGDVPF
jgi:taurine dioxygenase